MIKRGPTHSFLIVLQTGLEQLEITIEILVDLAAIVDVTTIMLHLQCVDLRLQLVEVYCTADNSRSR
jgi:hypothetical protein